MTTGKKSSMYGTLAMAVCLLMTAPAFGASARVNVPFAFEVSSVSLPAGSYVLETSDNGAILYVSNPGQERHAVLVKPERASKDPSEAKLVFERVGSTYRLAEVQMTGAVPVVSIPATSAQLLMAKTEQPARVVLALNHK